MSSPSGQSGRAPNDWEDVVLPVLLEMHAAEREGRKSRAHELLVELSGSFEHGYMTARRIRDAGLASGVSITMGAYRMSHASLTAEGMRAIGQWSDTALRGALLAVMEDAAERAPDKEGGALKVGARWLGDKGSDVLTQVLSAYLSRSLP